MSSKFKRAFILLIDGARPDVIVELLDAGQLPNIKNITEKNGTFKSAVTCFPSTTGPAYLPFLTGCFPGTCNVPGIRWLDKSKFRKSLLFGQRSYVGLESFLMGADIAAGIETVFEKIQKSYSIFNPITKGVGLRNLTAYSRIWQWYYAHLTDRWASCDVAAMKKLKKSLKHDPEFVFAVFPGIDEYSHLIDPRSDRTLERYKWFDNAMGDFLGELEKNGMRDDSAIFIVSDHGLSKTHTHFCLNRTLEDDGVPPFFYPKLFDKEGKKSANMISGNSMTHLYFSKDNKWDCDFDSVYEEKKKLIDNLLSKEAVAIVAAKGSDGWIKILSKMGRARLKLDGDNIYYEVSGGDPFGYEKLPSIMDKNDCLSKTFDSEYPDAPFQIAHLFTSSRCGDIVVSAKKGYDLRDFYEDPEHKGSHGSLIKEHMLVPVISNVKLKDEKFRTVDVYPTILKLLGYEMPSNIDGKPLI